MGSTIEAAIWFFAQRMLLFLRSLFGKRSHRVSVFSLTPPKGSNNNNHIYLCSLNGSSQLVSPFFLTCISNFLCFFRCPFGTEASFDKFGEVFDRRWVSEIVREGRWDDARIVNLFGSGLAPVWVPRILVALKEDPPLALKLFKWAKTRVGFCHTTESYCLLAHILFCCRMYADAHDILKDLVTSTQVLSVCDLFDVLWSTRNVCVSGYGVFDAFFSVLVELGMLEEASDCFLRMKRFRVLPKVRSCNNLLQRLSKTGKSELSRKFFRDMVSAGVPASVFTYNILIDYMCKEGDLKTAGILFEQMKKMCIMPDIVTYNTLIDGHGKLAL